jgi:hypothetical protein
LLVLARGVRRDQISPGNLNFDPAVPFNHHHLLFLSHVCFFVSSMHSSPNLRLVTVLGLGHDVVPLFRIVPGFCERSAGAKMGQNFLFRKFCGENGTKIILSRAAPGAG